MILLTRRKLLECAALGAVCIVADRVHAQEKIDWQKIIKQWMLVLLPADKNGLSGDCLDVWRNIQTLMQDSEFAQGFFGGVEAINTLPLPTNNTELTSLLKKDDPRSKFLNAFLEILIESFYGAAVGWSDLAITQPPQPLGYFI
jgi:hypothetical protein